MGSDPQTEHASISSPGPYVRLHVLLSLAQETVTAQADTLTPEQRADLAAVATDLHTALAAPQAHEPDLDETLLAYYIHDDAYYVEVSQADLAALGLEIGQQLDAPTLRQTATQLADADQRTALLLLAERSTETLYVAAYNVETAADSTETDTFILTGTRYGSVAVAPEELAALRLTLHEQIAPSVLRGRLNSLEAHWLRNMIAELCYDDENMITVQTLVDPGDPASPSGQTSPS